MPLQVDQLGIEFSFGAPAQNAQASTNDNNDKNDENGCCEDATGQKKQQEDRLVERVTARVLAAIRSEQER